MYKYVHAVSLSLSLSLFSLYNLEEEREKKNFLHFIYLSTEKSFTFTLL